MHQLTTGCENLSPEEKEALLKELLVHLGVADIADAFHRPRIHLELGEYFTYPHVVLARDFGSVGLEVSGKVLTANDWV